MTKPFKGVVNMDVRDSKPDWSPYDSLKRRKARPTSFLSCGMT